MADRGRKRSNAWAQWVVGLSFGLMAALVLFVMIAGEDRDNEYDRFSWTGSDWPFNVDAVEVECLKGMPLLSADGRHFALNGLAQQHFGAPYPFEGGIVERMYVDGREVGWKSVDKFRELAMVQCLR